MKIIKV